MIHMRKMNAFVTKLVLRCVNINILSLAVVAPDQVGRKVSGPSYEERWGQNQKVTQMLERNGWRERELRP